MKTPVLSRRRLAAAIAVLVTTAALHAPPAGAAEIADPPADRHASLAPEAGEVDHSTTVDYIVRFRELPLALYDGGMPGLQAIPRAQEPGARSHLDGHSAQATAYVAYLASQQNVHVAQIGTLLGRTLPVKQAMQHAVNAIVVSLSADEARQIENLPDVASVQRDTYRALATDLGPGFIGAASLWWGADAGVDTLFAGGFDAGTRYRGEGIVVGDIDTGYNSHSPSFAGTDDAGYHFVNPLGSGNYLGLCSPRSSEQPSTLYTVPFAGCNDKVIGAYDMIDAPPPGTGPFSAEDWQGHGSHTGSTAAGNTRNGTIGAYSARLSGVAPHANLVVYYACNAAGCPESATAAAVDQAVQDSVVDVLNFSISGGTAPWDNVVSQAFLGATEAGIFVAAAAGNTSLSVPVPLAGTANHFEPWVTTVAAANHSGGPLGYFLTASGSGAPPPIGMNSAPNSTQPSGAIATALALSPNFAAANDCSAFSAGQFSGKMLLMHFVSGPCGTNTMAANALAAGAAQVLLVNSSDDYINAGAAQKLPVFTTTRAQGNALATYVTAHAGAGANVSYPANTRLPVTPDSLANFSLLGPAPFDVIKPDVQAPGIAILAAFNNANPPAGDPLRDVPPSGAEVLGFDDGTSMATPHTTGSAALLLGLHPDWTPMEVKSALMMTAKEAALTKPDHTTPSDFYDRGAGRIQDDVAARAGLVLNESGLNFLDADPAKGGDPKSLNLASMQNANCVTPTGAGTSTAQCSWTRKFRSTQSESTTYTAKISGMPGKVYPPTFTVVGHDTRALTITADASGFASDGVPHFGELVLTPDDATLPTLHLPIAAALQRPAIAVTPTPLGIGIAQGATTASVTLSIANTGGPSLKVANSNDSTSTNGRLVVIDQPSNGTNGDYSDYFTDAQQGNYLAEDFPVYGTTNLSHLTFPGFMANTRAPLAGAVGNKIHFEVYADAGGAPNGNPETVAPSYVWNFVATIGSTAGLNVAGNSIDIDLVAAGATPSALAAGRYWMIAYPELTFAGTRWAQFESPRTFGYDAHTINPRGGFGYGSAWTDVRDAAYGNSNPGMALHVEASVACGAPWLSVTPVSFILPGVASRALTVTADSTKFASGTSASAFLCIDSNDAKFPVLAVPVSATQN